MTKRLVKNFKKKYSYSNQPLKINLATIILTGLCTFLIVIATFTQFDFYHFIIPLDFLNYIGSNFHNPAVMAHFLKHYRYIPQIPIIMYIAALLGRKFGITATVLYILAGLFLAPVFALGGGLEYVFEYGFGYILGYIPAVFFAGSILKSGLNYKNMAKSTLIGVLTIHLCGICYMLFIALLNKEHIFTVWGWIVAQSGTKILYDLIFSFIAMIAAKFTKKFLWIAIG
jgi:biotin transport system substrate-specific component